MKETPYNEETIDDEEKQSLFEKLIISATNTPQGTVKLSKIVSKRAIFLDFRQQGVFE